MDHNPPKHIVVVFSVALVLAGIGCRSDEPAPTSPAGENTPAEVSAPRTIHLPLPGEPETLDPARMTGVLEGRFAVNAFEGIYVLSHGTGEPTYGVANAHTRSADGLTWTFTLRPDARWSNGEQVTADDFVFAWKRVLTPGFDASYAEMLEIIDGAKAFRSGAPGASWSSVGVKALAPDKLIVRTRSPVPYLPQLLAFYTFAPVHQATLSTHGKEWTRPDNIVTNGPYALIEHKPQQHLILAKNPHHRDVDRISIDRIKFHIIVDNTAALNAFKSGAIDIMPGGLPVGKVPALRGMEEFRLDPLLGVYFYRFNVAAHPALAKLEVRKALSLALDREALVQRTLKGVHTVATGYVPPITGYKGATTLRYDPDEARRLLAEAGYPNGEGFPELALLFNTSENHKLLAEVIQSIWKRELGIEIKLENKEWKTFLESTKRGSYQIARGGWIGDYNDPDTFLSIMTTGNGNNRTGWGDPAYDALLLKAASERDDARRLELLTEAETILLEAAPIVPIYFYRNAQLVSKRVKGFKSHNQDVIQVRWLELTTP